MSQYAIGVDFGTLSARAIIIDGDGRQLVESVCEYSNGVLDKTLPGGEALGPDWALQVPADYMEALVHTVRDCMAQAKLPPSAISGIGIDFTSCSMLPTTAEGVPLCQLPAYVGEPHAYAKLWKHHAAQYCADIVNRVAAERGEPWLPLYGGKLSSEWTIPKALQILKEAPHIYSAMHRFIECGDWVVWQLCGREVRSACNAGYKAQWRHGHGYFSRDFFAALDPRMADFAQDKLVPDVHALGQRAGTLTAEMAARLGLTTGCAVAVGIIDAHASLPACGIAKPGKMLMAMGTSTCHLLLSETEKPVPGVCGVVKDGILPGFYAYEAGQSCVGDHFSWFVENCLPAAYQREAETRDITAHQLLCEKAVRQRPGQHGLLALDWWNGVRSPLIDFDLSGLLVGLTLATKPEDIYRALIEATAYGTRLIIETFRAAGVPVDGLYAGGGIARKNPMAMQIYADVTGCEIQIVESGQSGALGAAILGLAAGSPGADLIKLVKHIGRAGGDTYIPTAENAAIYDDLYVQYVALHRHFGAGESDIMHVLKKIKSEPR